jgi:large subunit ribosomal protein L4e
MKSELYTKTGSSKGSVDLPKIFESKVREDIVAKYFEVDKTSQPYSPDKRAGRKHSASGTISHKRHDWKGHYGKGISRIPRKTMWRRGTQFFWIGAEISSTRGGRRAHGPKGIGKEKKINKKEVEKAMSSGFSATASKDYVLERYATLKEIKEVPRVIEELPEKTKDLILVLKKLYPGIDNLVLKSKEIRAGRGKLRGRKYKSNAGVLIVKGSEEKVGMKGFDIKAVDEVRIGDLYPLGRITLYTQKALEDLGNIGKVKSEKSEEEEK